MKRRAMLSTVAALFALQNASAGTLPLQSVAGALAAAGGPLRQVTFEDISTGTDAPFVSLGVQIDDVVGGIPGTGAPVVVEQFGGDHFALFSGHGSPSRFMVTNHGFAATFNAPVDVIGFAMRSSSCVAGQDGRMGWRTFDAGGVLLDSGELQFDEGCPDATLPVYVGLHAQTPFHRVEFHREAGANFVVDDVQYGPIEGLGDQPPSVFPSRFLANFDDVPVNSTAPIASGDLLIAGPGQVADQFFGFDHVSVFGGLASPPHMLTTNFAFVVDAPGEVGALSFHLRGAGCSDTNFITVDGFDAQLQQVDSVAFAASGCDLDQLGVTGLRPSHRLNVRALRMPNGFVNAVIDDLALQDFGIFGDGFEDQ